MQSIKQKFNSQMNKATSSNNDILLQKGAKQEAKGEAKATIITVHKGKITQGKAMSTMEDKKQISSCEPELPKASKGSKLPKGSALDEIELIQTKMAALEKKTRSVKKEVFSKKSQLKEADQEIGEIRLRWDISQAQVKDLGEQLSRETYKIYSEVGSILQKSSRLTTEMYYFL